MKTHLIINFIYVFLFWKNKQTLNKISQKKNRIFKQENNEAQKKNLIKNEYFYDKLLHFCNNILILNKTSYNLHSLEKCK